MNIGGQEDIKPQVARFGVHRSGDQGLKGCLAQGLDVQAQKKMVHDRVAYQDHLRNIPGRK